ncbi:MAG: YbbR-like domain-containing protein [Alloprevotella sp.]|nr:YbbR-like domain-containing protein [Alloprevotella sp.]
MDNNRRKTSRSILALIWNKQTLTFCFFLFLSIVFWLITKLNGTYQQDYAIPLQLEGVPAEVVITTAPPKEINVSLTDKGWALLSYRLSNKLKPITIDFNEATQANGMGTISSAELTRQISKQISGDTHIVAIRPQQVSFYYNYGEKKRVPVEVVGNVVSDNQYFILSLLAEPDSVTVYARPSTLDTLVTAKTKPLYMHNVSDTVTVETELEMSPGVKYEPSAVKVLIKTDRLVEKSLQVPIQQANFPAEKALRTFPSKVTVNFQVGMQQYRDITPDDFIIVITYDDLLQNSTSRIKVTLKSMPQGVKRVKIQPEEVEYVIEDIAADGKQQKK